MCFFSIVFSNQIFGCRGGEMHLGGQGGLTLPDSLAAGRGEAMPWEKAEAAEKGSGAFSQSPISSRRSRADRALRTVCLSGSSISCGQDGG